MQPDKFPGSFFGPTTLVDLLRHRAQNQPLDLAYTFLVDGDTEEARLTYAEADRRARAIAAWLEAQDLQGQRAVLLYPPGLDFIVGFFGCLYAGVIAVPAYPPRMNRKFERIQGIVDDCDAKVALTVQSVLDRVRPQIESTPELSRIEWLATDQLPPRLEEQWLPPDIDSSTLAFLQYTSGSTGKPKGVMLTHANLLHNSALICHAYEHSRSNIGVFWLPSYHDMGLVGGILQPLYVARPNVLMSPVAFLQRPLRWLQAISRYRGTTSGGPNFAYDLCVRRITPEERSKLDLSSWSVAFNGAEPIRAETLERFAEFFAPCGFRREAFYPCYGLAEATLLVSGGYVKDPPVIRSFDAKALENRDVLEVDGSDRSVRRLVGSGQNLPDQEIVVVDPETLRRVEPSEVGEIWVKGPSVALGYWQRSEETAHAFRARLADGGDGPFLRTGDLGFFQGNELFVAGRLKDLIIIHGLNHYPHDIELTVEKSHSAMRPSCGAAFTVEDDDSQRLVIVYEVERRQVGVGDFDAVMQAIRKSVAREHDLMVDCVVLVKPNSIPKTSSGKIQRHACRDAFIEGTLDTIASWTSDGTVETAEAVEAAVNGHAAHRAEERSSRTAHAESHAIEHTHYKHQERAMHVSPSRSNDDDRANVPAADAERRTVAQPPVPREMIGETVLDIVKHVAKERAKGMTLDSNIAELGLDSLERMEILAAIEERLGGRFPEEVLGQIETCREVIEAAERYLGREAAAPPAVEPARPETPVENYDFSRWPEVVKLKESMSGFMAAGLANPFFKVHQRVTRDTTVIDGREFINFSSYNYVGMSGDPKVTAAAKEAVDRYGTSVSASRLVSGEKTIHQELERALSEFIGAEAAIVFVGGHATNETVIGHLLGSGDLVLHDALAHNSIIQGCLLSGARRRPFPHNDWQAVDEVLREVRGEYRRVLIAIEGVYSMDGDMPDLPRFIEVKRRHKALLMVDEAHSMGVLGPRGRGIGEHFEVHPSEVDIWMGTLSKSFGSCGGYIAGCQDLIDYLKYTAPGFVYSVGMSPPNAAAALASIRLLENEPERVTRLHQRSELFLTLAKERRLNTGMSGESPVVPIILGNSIHALALSWALWRRGINVQPILYPAVEERAARLRFFITSTHTEEQIRYTVDAVAEEIEKISPHYTAGSTAAAAR